MLRQILRAFSSILVGASFVVQAEEIRIEAFFEPSTIPLSHSSSYRIVVNGTQKVPLLSPPAVPGLEFSSNPQTLRSASWINGVASVKLEFIFRATPKRSGRFEVPEWPAKIDNQSLSVPSARLVVGEPSPQQLIRQKEEKDQQEKLKSAAFLEFSSPRPFLFEGESAEATVRLFLWDRLPVTRIDQAPLKRGEAFSVSELGQPSEQRNVVRENKSYSVFTWKVGLTGAIPGTKPLGFTSVIAVRVKERRDSLFSNPFFNDPFFGFGRETPIEVTSDETSMEVRPLPTEGRPSDFNGAIGNFEVVTGIDTNLVSLGDPVRLTYSIRGAGNFSAMPAPTIKLSDSFKIGPPNFKFTGDELTKHKGTQDFEYVLTPLKSGSLEIPSLSFSFFDPVREKYFSRLTNPHPLLVEPGESWNAPKSENPAPARSPATSSRRIPSQMKLEGGDWTETFAVENPLRSIVFWASHCSILLAFSATVFLRSRNLDPLVRSKLQKERTLDAKLRNSIRHKDAYGFYQALRRRIRLRIGLACKCDNVSALSRFEAVELLRQNGYSEELVRKTDELLGACENSAYGGVDAEVNELEPILLQARSILKKIRS